MIGVLMVITCCTLTSAVIHTFGNNRNQYYRRNGLDTYYRRADLDTYYRRNGLDTYQQGGYFNYGGFLDNLSPDPVCGRTLTKFDCPLFDFRSNLVSKDDFLNAISSESVWFIIYSRGIGTPNPYGTCQFRFESPVSNGDFVQREQCFNLDTNKCEDFTLLIRLEEDECGRVKVQGVNFTSDVTIYSQDINQYYWRELCINRIDEDQCEGGRYIGLNVKGSRLIERRHTDSSSESDLSTESGEDEGHVVDLTSLPWDLISADLKNIYDSDFSDPEMRYVFLGNECEV
ncbi:uncharacterized protein LOC132748664 [Ruditapes philippinarum]|uniref:uncharacterized protein LOC132748664 n=1 Tax=Ruditapes philippinarum TaxID=129788 RepID=UPI00295BC041|nr:uncharacterized protein LOC132748664 [Ruditapes philippinarum]